MGVKGTHSVSKLTTLGIGGEASEILYVDSKEQLKEFFNKNLSINGNFFVLGEGSNILFSDHGFNGTIIKLVNKGINIVCQTDNFVKLTVSAGENWDDFVNYTVINGFWGVENMSLIPGSVGACPVQNVGAYGQDCRSVIDRVEVFDTCDNQFKFLTNEECCFGFRSSIFNKERKNRYIITSVDFLLSTIKAPNLSRSSISSFVRESLESLDLQKKIRDAVIKERTSGINLPNDLDVGCAGTFFRTALVSKSVLPKVLWKTTFSLGPKIALMMLAFTWKYRSNDGCKLPSKFLIQSCGLSNLRSKSVFLLPSNPAVLATDLTNSPRSEDAVLLIKTVRNKVYRKTGIIIPIEPSLIGFSEDELQSILLVE